jgi:hypothetical protein
MNTNFKRIMHGVIWFATVCWEAFTAAKNMLRRIHSLNVCKNIAIMNSSSLTHRRTIPFKPRWGTQGIFWSCVLNARKRQHLIICATHQRWGQIKTDNCLFFFQKEAAWHEDEQTSCNQNASWLKIITWAQVWIPHKLDPKPRFLHTKAACQ